MEIHSVLELLPRLPVDVVEKMNFLWSTKFERGTEVNHFANKKFPQTTSYPSLRLIFKESLLKNGGDYFTQVRNSGFEIFFRSDFSDLCGISKDS